MATCEPIQYKVPLKSCQNSVIDHNLVTIWLGLEWPEKCGDDPSLVIHVANKQPSPPYLHQNQTPVLGNTVHHHHPRQENVGSTYQQPYYHSSGINNHDLSSSTTTNPIGDHNNVSSTTTTVIYNSIQPQSRRPSSPAAIQRIKTQLKSQLPLMLPHQQYLSSQHVMQTPSTNMNDSRLDTKMSTISPTSSIKPLPSMTQFIELQQPPTITCSSPTIKTLPLKSLVCSCPNPPSYHLHNCPISSSNNQESNTNISSESMNRPSINRTNAQRIVSTSQIPGNGAISIPPMKDPMITTTFLTPQNSNFMKTFDSSSGVTTIISQPSSFLNNTQMGPTIKTSSLDTGNTFQHPPVNFSQVIINNQSNFQTNPSMSIPIVKRESTTSNKSRQRKNPIKRDNLTNQDQTSFQNPNNSQQQIYFINNQNSSTKSQDINPSGVLSSSIQNQQGTLNLQDNSQIIDNTTCSSTNDTKVNTSQQESPHMNPMVRSPVKLDISASQNINQIKMSPDAIMEQTICEVAKGKGDISVGKSSTAPQQQKPSLTSQIVWESNGSTPTTRTCSSPSHHKQQLSTYDSTTSTLSRQNVVAATQQVICSNLSEQSQMGTLSQQPTTKNNKNKNRSKSTNNSESKRTKKSIINTQRQTTISSSHQDISPTITSHVTSTSNKRMSWSDTPISSSSSSGDVTIPYVENSKQHLTNDALQMPDIDNLNYSVFDDEQIQTIYPNNDHHQIELDDIFSSKIDDPFTSSTPPPLSSLSMSESLLNQVSAEKSSSTSITSLPNPLDVYENYFPSSSSTWEENQVTSSVLTPPDAQNNQLPQRQYYSQTNTFTNSNLPSQTSTSKFIETSSHIVNRMNNNDDVQTSSKQKQTKTFEKPINKSLKHPPKNSKQQNRPKSIQKQPSTKPTCTRCGFTQLIDITRHEFPKQKGLVFECASCGNNSIRSNVSADERRRRLAKVAADHLHKIECHFCHEIFHSHNDYLNHLRTDHESNKPM